LNLVVATPPKNGHRNVADGHGKRWQAVARIGEMLRNEFWFHTEIYQREILLRYFPDGQRRWLGTEVMRRSSFPVNPSEREC
jgi:hypothetical protein